MKTQVKQWGSSMVIVLDTEFVKFHNLKVGEWVDLSDLVKVVKKPKSKSINTKEVKRTCQR